MKIALAQLNYHIGNFEDNVNKIRQAIEKGRQEKADLVVFAELAISGYPPRDFLEFDDFIQRCRKAAEEIASACKGIAAIIGCPVVNTEERGKPLYNAALFMEDGKIRSEHYKALLPNYDVFDEYRYFEPARKFSLIDFKGCRIAPTICEDIWNIGSDLLYVTDPMEELIKGKPDLIINIAASPFHYDQPGIRKDVLKTNAVKYHLPVLYVNHIGAQTELLFDGGSMTVSPDGRISDQLDYFKEDFRVYDLEKVINPPENLPSSEKETLDKIALIHDALVMGIRNYFNKMGFNKALLGLSGGIDSAVTLVLASKALGKENVWAILLPSAFSSDLSISDAEELARNLDCRNDTISIEDAFRNFNQILEPYFKGLPFDLAEENMQARIRAVILMALSNKFGHILLNTSNKSEAAVGYGTLYGDMCGGLAVLGDVYKTQVYELARYINKLNEIIPASTISKPPSAELRPEQKDSDSLPEYDILDQILYQYIELRKGPRDLIGQGFDERTVKYVLKLINTSEYKRYQTPPILRVSPKAFGMGRRMPIVAKYLS